MDRFHEDTPSSSICQEKNRFDFFVKYAIIFRVVRGSPLVTTNLEIGENDAYRINATGSALSLE